ncbi:methyltransferase domain-containing protein [Streptomyces sp. DSM 41527]|uniref:Methyltransferase domain-containing protein n=1 Tax=Streptomyces mooreae TaxID=3075523 RepID=A0ABU2TEF9_9ACTN|nr:methyltransferase domain-containing protein [Streptomyces sp. DSM 41527]MDT0459265.1 methyltransferase domain-containing protein [Streptomyces sp. DSM 41527]
MAEDFPGLVPVRDSKNPHGPTLLIPHATWSTFVDSLKVQSQCFDREGSPEQHGCTGRSPGRMPGMMTAEEQEKYHQAGSFGTAADAYERGRPPYPREAVAWLVPEDARTVVDLGAGTGKLTRALRAPGREVVAVEPSVGMREQFSQVLPDVRVLEGTGESIPLPESSVDTLVCAQAWHWVAPERAVPEAVRVLRPGGRLGLVWNSRDVSVPWVAELDRILRDCAAAPTEDRQVDCVGVPFGPVERQNFRWNHPMTAGEVMDMVASRSYVITLEPATREELLGRVHALLDSQRPMEMPYVTECYRAELGSL